MDAVVASIGFEGKIKAKKGSWITLSEYEYNEEKGRYVPVCVKSAQIDGKVLKEDVLYVLSNGEFVEA